MEKITRLDISVFIGALGGFIGNVLGGWDIALRVALTLMCTDFIVGFIVAFVFKSSSKTKNGKISSEALFKGLVKKGLMLVMILVGHQLDIVTNQEILRNGVCYYIIVMEVTSLIESWSISGLSYPKIFDKVLEVLSMKTEGK